MRYIISILILFSFFSCHRKDYNENELLKAFINHSYYSYSESDIKTAMKYGEKGLKKLDKNFEIIPIKGKKVLKNKDTKEKIELYYPFILKRMDNRYLIVKVFDYSIAFQAGLKNGFLNSINGKDVNTLAPDILEGEIDKSNEIAVSFNDGNADWSMNIKKEISAFPFVWSIPLNETSAYINIMSFSKNSAQYFKNNITNLSRKGIRKLIIDLRCVAGGNYEEAARIAGYFSADRKTYSIRSSKKGYNMDFSITENPFVNFKTVVLVNADTVLLGEAVAQSLKESGATIVGEKTNGNIYITELFKIGNDAVASMSVAKLYPPSNRDMDEGITPDYNILFNDYKKFSVRYVIDTDPLIARASELLASK